MGELPVGPLGPGEGVRCESGDVDIEGEACGVEEYAPFVTLAWAPGVVTAEPEPEPVPEVGAIRGVGLVDCWADSIATEAPRTRAPNPTLIFMIVISQYR